MKQVPLSWAFIRISLASFSLVGVCLFLLTLGVQAADHARAYPVAVAQPQPGQRPLAYVTTAADVQEPTAVLLREGFEEEPFPPTGWQTASAVDTCTWSRVTQGVNPSQLPYAGSGQALFNAYNCPDGGRAVLTLSPVDLSGNGNLCACLLDVS